MASAFWNACSEGDLEKVCQLLQNLSGVDVEVRDHNGVTPLIEATKNGHVEIVRVLLDHGADPTNASPHGPPEKYTSHPTVLDLLRQAQEKRVPRENTIHQNTYHQESSEDIDKQYYSQPPNAYPYYPPLNGAPPPMPDGTGAYYPPPPPQAPGENTVPGGLGNLPPPEIARSIPCRYFPACRYGASCMFAHPQNPPYFQGPVHPPAQYMPYDPSLGPQPYVPNYYPVPPPSFQQPNGVPHVSSMSPPPGPPPIVHGRSSSELVSPVSNPYNANGMSPLPYGSMLPPVYPPPPGQVPVPISVSPMSSVHPQPPIPLPAPPSPSAMYSQLPHPAPLYNGQPDINGSYQLPPNAPVVYVEGNGHLNNAPSNHQNDGFARNSQGHRDGAPHGRRGTGRKGSFSSRKPACLFYPMGRCKNGNDCRFPHVIPDSNGAQNLSYPNRNGTRSRGNNGGNDFTAIDEKMANMNIHDDPSRSEAPSRDQNHGQGGRPKFDRGSRHHHGGNLNGSHANKRLPPAKQRVPNADDFPVLGGSTTPPTRQPNGLPDGAPTAAQVLQAPPPVKREASQATTRGPTPDSAGVNGIKEPPSADTENLTLSLPTASYPPQQPANKLPLSFAAAASSSADAPKEVTVPA